LLLRLASDALRITLRVHQRYFCYKIEDTFSIRILLVSHFAEAIV